jgi:hypothetical protein
MANFWHLHLQDEQKICPKIKMMHVLDLFCLGMLPHCEALFCFAAFNSPSWLRSVCIYAVRMQPNPLEK